MSAKNDHNPKNPPNFLNEKGEVDFAKLLEANPDLLSSFVHKRQDEEGGEGGSEQKVSMSFAVGMAALRDALGLSQSYAPLNSAEQVRDMSMSAQFNLGLEASQGLSMEMGGKGTFSAAHDVESHNHKKDKKENRKKLKE